MFKNLDNNEVSEMVAAGFIEENCYTAGGDHHIVNVSVVQEPAHQHGC